MSPHQRLGLTKPAIFDGRLRDFVLRAVRSLEFIFATDRSMDGMPLYVAVLRQLAQEVTLRTHLLTFRS